MSSPRGIFRSAKPPGPTLARLRALVRSRLSREGAVGLYFTVGFLACAFLVVLFGALAAEVLDRERLAALDHEVTLAIREYHAPGLDRVARAVTFLGDHAFLMPATIIAAAVLAIRGRRVSAMLFAGSVLGGFALNSLLKLSFARARPDLWEALVAERTYSFPSGHAAMATVFFGGLAAVVFHVTPRPSARLASLAGAAAMIAVVAASRVYLGAHWLTDIVAGTLVGLFWIAVSATGTEFFARRADMRKAEIKPF